MVDVRVRFAAVAMLSLIGCAAPGPVPPSTPPHSASAAPYWDHALAELRVGNEMSALTAMEEAAEKDQRAFQPLERVRFASDLAELRLAAGDRAGATEAADQSAQLVSAVPGSATFTQEERLLYARLARALQSAARDDFDGLQGLAREPATPPLADPWYLLGRQAEQRGDLSTAALAYGAYLDLSPRFALLRRTALMRGHARAFLETR